MAISLGRLTQHFQTNPDRLRTPQSSPQSLESLDLNGKTIDFSSNRPGFGLFHQVLPLGKTCFFSSDLHRETLSWHSFWHTIWKYIWHIYSDYLTYFLAYLLTFYVTFYLASTLTYFLAYLLTFSLAFYLLYLRRFFVVEVRRGTLWSWACCSGPAGTTVVTSLQLRSGGGEGGQLT